MSDPSELATGLRAHAEAILADGRFRNFVAQSHSRDVLRHLRVPPDQWPSYTATLDDDLVYAAQSLLYVGLRLKQETPESADSDVYLTRGAEILEHVYARADDGDPERPCQLFSAALAYYMAGHFARAFVLIRDLEAEAPLPRFLRPIRHLLLKDLRPLRREVIDRLLQAEYGDDQIAAAVAAGELDEDQALCRVLEATMYRALSHFLEHIRTGDAALLEEAERLVDVATEVSVDHRFADWWWYFACVRVLLGTFRRHSLWTNLGPFFARPAAAELARQYVRANLRLPTPVVELWPSQVTAIPHLFAEGGQKNLCVRMPTSAGKTKVAELAVLAHLKDGIDPEFRCVYVAPYRSLAVEVEQTLREALLPLGLRVSELYGGFELTATDRLLIENTHVLVATPEKFDAFVRFSPDLAGQVKLVILDEGHIVTPVNFTSLRQSRGLKYEVFLQRLVSRCGRSGARIVFLSAVMPNAGQFAEWITGGTDGLVESDWRPSRLMVGAAVWDGSAVSLEFTHADRHPLGHRCFVPRFVTQRPADGWLGRRKLPFPKDGDEALALTALDLARHKLTMVFVARKASAEPFGRTILDCLKLRGMLPEAAPPELPIDPRHQPDLDRCLRLIGEHMGEGSDHLAFLRAGFIVHHGSIPQPVRIALERLVRSGAIRLVVATTTLAQGVNFPIHTVLVHSLDHGQDSPVSPMDFWNICGRAGRGMKENEGQILFFAEECFAEWRKGRSKKFKAQSPGWQQRKWREWCEEQRSRHARYIEQHGNYQVESGLLSLINRVIRLWQERHRTVDVPALCEALANHRLDLFAGSEDADLESVLSTLDGLLIAMTEECDAEEITPDTFQDLLCRSLVHLQLTTPDARQTVNEILASRVRYIRCRFPEQARRWQFYQLGLPLRDCEAIEAKKDELLGLYLKAVDYEAWPVGQRAGHLADIAEHLFLLSEIAPGVQVPLRWRRILELWLSGQTPTGILGDAEVVEEGLSAHDLNRWMDDALAYRLPWGLNSLSVYLRQYAEGIGAALPEVTDYYSSFVKYGAHEPAVCWLLALGVPSRGAAARVGALLAGRVGKPDALLRWLGAGGIERLLDEGLSEPDADLLRATVLRAEGARMTTQRPVTVRLRTEKIAGPIPTPGTRALLEPAADNEPNRYRLLSLSGELMTTFRLESDRLAALMATPDFVTATVVEPEPPGTGETLRIRVEPI